MKVKKIFNNIKALMELNANFNDELNKQLKEAKAKVKEEKEKHDKYGPQKFYMK